MFQFYWKHLIVRIEVRCFCKSKKNYYIHINPNTVRCYCEFCCHVWCVFAVCEECENLKWIEVSEVERNWKGSINQLWGEIEDESRMKCEVRVRLRARNWRERENVSFCDKDSRWLMISINGRISVSELLVKKRMLV